MYVVSTTHGTVEVDADEHRVEGAFHVFRTTAHVMGRPRLVVVRRLSCAEVREVRRGPSPLP